MKEKWFEYIVNHKELWTNGMTKKRLEKAKQHVFNDKDIMFDLLNRHSANTKTPEEMKEHDKFQFDHCIGNFVCSIHYVMIDKNII